MQTDRIPVADDVQLAVDRWPPAKGAAPDPVRTPFVLVHGLASNARLWDGAAARLTGRGHPVVTLDLRGHGRSSKPDGPFDVPTVADDVAAVISALDLARPIVAGQSWGGNVVLELAARRPDLIRGVVCVDGGWIELRRRFATWEACRAALAPPRLVGRPAAEMEAHMRARHPDWPVTGIRGAMANFEVRDDGTIAPWLTFDRHIEVLRALWDHRPSERYAEAGVPVLLVPARHADGEDPERARDKAQDVAEAASAIPNARVHWFTGDHDIHAQHPDELADVMSDLARDGFFA
jgi:pimeloyl-ACP methyl ester carboxylesterase